MQTVRGVEFKEGDQVFHFWNVEEEENVHSDGNMAGNMEVTAGDVINGGAGGADNIQDTTTTVVGKLLMSWWMLQCCRNGEMAQS